MPASNSAAKSVPQAVAAPAEPTITLTVSELAAVIARATAAAVANTTPGVGLSPAAPPTPVRAEVPASAAEYLTTRQAAELLGLSVKGLEQMRAAGRGPKFVRIGHRIRYRRADLA